MVRCLYYRKNSSISSGNYFLHKILNSKPPFGKLAAQQAHYEGDLRFVHSRLLTNAEEISFYRGHKIEENILNNRYMALIK